MTIITCYTNHKNANITITYL